MGLPAVYVMFARYNMWANARLYAAAALLSEADYARQAGAYFGSLKGTLNHLLVVDRLWMRRFTGAGTGEAQDRLDAILFEDLDALRAARAREDARILDWVSSLRAADFAGMLRYRTLVGPAEIAQPLAAALGHFFNHQTHHRGQAHGLLTHLAGRDGAPSLDLLVFQRETGCGLA